MSTAAAASVARPLLAWSVRDKLLLADLVAKYGNQNWVSERGRKER